MTACDPILAAGLERHRAGALEEAGRLYRQALERRPGDAEALHLLGLLAFQSGRAEEALALIGRALALKPAAVYHANAAKILDALARLEEALPHYRRAAALSPALETWGALGGACARAARLDEAIESFGRAVVLCPGSAEARSNLGNALREAGRPAEAVAELEAAAASNPGLAAAWINLAAALDDLDRLEEAAAALDRALALEPASGAAHSNLAGVLTRLGRAEEALAHAACALELAPACAEAWNNRGAALEQAGRVFEAVRCYQEAIRLRPRFAEAHRNLGMALLVAGEFEAGWGEYEWRWRVRGPAPRSFAKPLWDGAPLAGRTILLHAEQGLGDTVQFVRYAALVAARRGRVLLECPARLAPLLAGAPGVTELFRPGDPFDLHAPLMSLPRIFGTVPETIPAGVPYLVVPPERVERAKGRIRPAPGLRVGLVWASGAAGRNARARSIPPGALGPLAEVRGATLFSLQRGPAPRPALPLVELEQDGGDILDTAASMLNLDLVITADTLAAHLAGALARPVWTLLPFAPDFRWLLGRAVSPWYPTMRLFRQPRPGDWAAVIGQVTECLRHAAE